MGLQHPAPLQEAIWRERKVRLAHRGSDGSAVERLVDPLGLVAKGNLWCLVAGVEGAIRSAVPGGEGAVGAPRLGERA